MLKAKLSSFLILIISLVFFYSQATSVKAEEAYYKSYNVNVDISSDSTFIVTEDITVYFSGVFRKVFRGITLDDLGANFECSKNQGLQCGGFSYIEFIGFLDHEGNMVSEENYTLENVIENDEQRLKATWNFAPDGKSFSGEDFNYKIKYKIFGGLGFYNDYDLFYWDMLPADRPTSIQDTSITLNFPQGFIFNKDNFKVLTNSPYTISDYTLNTNANIVNLATKGIFAKQDLTISLKIQKGLITPPGSIQLTSDPDPIDVNINGVLLESVSKNIEGIPAGDIKLKFSKQGYISKEVSAVIVSNDINKIDIKLDKDPGQILLEILLVLFTCCSCLFLPLGLLWIYINWFKKGRDPKYRDTIVPVYNAPAEIKPYLLGAIKDEKVDMVEITATLIDIARQGYVKIREFETGKILGFGGKKDYELIKLKEFDNLTKNEKLIAESIFNYKERVIVSEDLENKFYSKVPTINNAIYSEMVELGYFRNDPDSVRNKYRLIGISLTTIAFLILSFFGAILIVVFPILIIIIDFFILGIVFMIISNYMPVKSLKGAKALNQIKGFRMYLNTAERFRVQDLTPETFEKFLPYAMVFGIEKEWANRFKDIYKIKPDWYDSTSFNTFNTIYLINSLSNFSTSTVHALTYSPSSSSSSGRGFGGGGWSGGGGFGGSFGGGGGGGGSSGWG